jgi:hypothetical protein
MVNNIYIATGVTPNYVGRARAFLNSVSENSQFKNVIIIAWNEKIRKIRWIDWLAIANLLLEYKQFGIKIINYSKVQEKNSIFCLQNGEFIKSFNKKELKEDPIIIFCDSDIVMQRPFSIEEINKIKSLNTGEIMLGINENDQELLIDEAIKLGAEEDFINKIKSDLHGYKAYNTGLLVARSSTYINLIKEFNIEAPRFKNKFKHYAMLQWIICYVIQTRKFFRIVNMDSCFHSHCHREDRKSNPGTECDKNGFIINLTDMKPVLFNHKYCDDFIKDKIFNSVLKYASNDIKKYY